MLQGDARILASDKRRRLAAMLLLVNVGLVVLAAAWRHAAADPPDSVTADAADQSAADAPQVELPQAAEAQLPLPSPSTSPPSAPAPRSALADDPVMEELRNVIRDPDNGLELPRLDESSPLASGADAPPPASGFDLRLQQRIETMHALSVAALALAREARSLSDAGRSAESARLMQHAAELRAMIAEHASIDQRMSGP